jgi:hypothetical protein
MTCGTCGPKRKKVVAKKKVRKVAKKKTAKKRK